MVPYSSQVASSRFTFAPRRAARKIIHLLDRYWTAANVSTEPDRRAGVCACASRLARPQPDPIHRHLTSPYQTLDVDSSSVCDPVKHNPRSVYC